MDFSKRLLMYETNSKTNYVDYGEIVSIINDKLVNVNMGGQRDTNGALVILEAVAIEGNYIAQVGDWVGVEWRSGVPIAIGSNNIVSSYGLKNINDSVKIVSQQDMASGVINSDHVRTDTIEARHIKVGTIQAQHISANTIQSSHISAGSIDATHIKSDSIQAMHISANAINTNHLSANSITAVKISAGSINAGHISANSINSNHISANAVTSDKIAANTISGGHIIANTISGGHIIANTISGNHIASNTITAGNMRVGTITASSGIIADAAIGTAHIISGSIVSAHISNATIRAAHIASANITSVHIASGTIGNAHISNLDASKINAGFISVDRIQAQSITGAHISANSINGDRIIGNSIEANRIKAGSISAREIGAQTITANEIQAGSISGDKIRAQSITAEHISARGIDVSNNIMIYNSATGETLIGGGYLRVDGLDVGVIQSDNLLANGLFLNASSGYGLLKHNPVGETMIGSVNREAGAHEVWKYNLADGTFISKIAIEGKRPFGIAIDEEDLNAYVTVQGDNTLVQINIATDTISTTNTLTMGMGPSEVKYYGIGLMDHKHFFILNTDQHDHNVPDSIIIVDAPPASVNNDLYKHHEIAVGNTPYDMVLDSNKILYITQAEQGDIAVIDMSSHDSSLWKVIRNIPISATGTDNYHGGLPSTFGLGFVTGGDSAGAYDAANQDSNAGSAHVHGGYGSSTGSAKKYSPKGIAQSADIDTLYVVDSENNELVIIDKYGKAPYNALTGIDESSGNMGSHSGHMGPPPASGGASPASARGNFANTGGPRTYWVRYRIPVGDNPDRVEIMNGKIFITLQGSGQLAIIDEEDILDQIALDRSFYTPEWTPLSEMRKVPPFSVRTVTVGSRPTKMLANTNSNTMIISLTGQNRVAYFDTINEELISTINTGSNPIGLAMTNDGSFLYVVNNGNGGDLSFIYPKGPYIGDPYIGLEGMVEYQGAANWTPYRTDWRKDTSGNVTSSSTIEFRVNEPFLNEGGYGAIRIQGKEFQEAWIQQDIYNVENFSNGNNVIDTIGERLFSISGNQSTWYSQADWLTSPAPTFTMAVEASGNTVVKTPVPPSEYVVNYTSPTTVVFNTPVPSGNWIEANYTTRNNLWYKPHNGSVLIALENSSTDNFSTDFVIEEFLPKFVTFDNQKTERFTPIEDGIDEEYTGLEYSYMTNRAKGKPVTSSSAPIAGDLSLVSDGLQLDDFMDHGDGHGGGHGDGHGDHMTTMSDPEPYVTLAGGLQYVQIDLGSKYMVGKITVSHMHDMDRVYQGTKTEVSEDGITWTTVYDSAVSGLYNEKLEEHVGMEGHMMYAHFINFPAKPVRYVRDWANGYKEMGMGTTINENHWTDIKVFGDWELDESFTYSSGEFEGQQIATNNKGIVTTDIPKAYIAIDIAIEFTSWWYMTYIVGPEFGSFAIEMPTIMNSNHTLSLTNEYINKIAHRHIMSFPPSTLVEANPAGNIKAGKHRAVIRQESGKVSFDRLRFEDFQHYKSNPKGISKVSTYFTRYSLVPEQAKWYQGQGIQSTFGAYDTPRTNPDSGLPDYSVPIKYRFKVKAWIDVDGINEERGVAYVTSAIMETGKQSTHWRPSAASDFVAGTKIEPWDSSQPHKTGLQSHHLANGSVRGAKILPAAVMDYHISPYARIEETKLNLRYPTHQHGRLIPASDPMAPSPFIFISNKAFLDSLEGFAGSGGTYGTSSMVSRADHDHDYLGADGTASDSDKLGGQLPSAYLRSNTSGKITGGLEITSTLSVTGNTIVRGTLGVTGTTTLAALTSTGITVNGNISITGTVDGVDISGLNSTVNTATSNIGAHANSISVLNGDIVTVNQSLSSLSTNISTVSSNVSAISGNISVISGNISAINGNIAGISGSIVTTNSTIAAHMGAGGSAHSIVVSSGNAGFMSGPDKAKLDAIQVGAINQATSDSRYLKISGGNLTGELSIVTTNGGGELLSIANSSGKFRFAPFTDGYDWIQAKQKIKMSGLLGVPSEEIYLHVSGNNGVKVNGFSVWHSGNFIPADYYTKTQTDNLLTAAGDIRAGQANTFNHAGLAVKVQPSANVSGTQKLVQVNNSSSSELFSISHNGDVVVKNNLIVEGTTQYAGTTTVDGDYTITGDLGVSGNSVLTNANIATLTIPNGGVIRQIGKEVEVMRFPMYGVGGDLQFETDSTTYDTITSHLSLFNTSYAMPSVPSGATRKYKFLISYSTSSTNNSSFRAVQGGTTTEIMTYNMIYTSSGVNGSTVRTVLTSAFTTAYVGNVDLQARTGTASTSLMIKYVEIIAYDVY